MVIERDRVGISHEVNSRFLVDGVLGGKSEEKRGGGSGAEKACGELVSIEVKCGPQY